MEIELIAVESSHISAIGYDPDNGVLQIEFTDGKLYEYYDVPQYVYDDFYYSESKGRYAQQNIYKFYRQSRIK